MNDTAISIDVNLLPDHLCQSLPGLIDTAAGPSEMVPRFTEEGHPIPSEPAYEVFSKTTGSARRASRITVTLNVPDTLVGYQFQQGASTFAAGRAALEIARIELARKGLPKDALDKLTTAHVSLERASVPFLIRLGTAAQTSALAKAVPRYARLLGLSVRRDLNVNAFIFGEKQPGCSQTGLATTRLPQELEVSMIFRPSQRVVRVDVCLPAAYLQSHDWTQLDSWRTAYADNRYETVFNQNVRQLFHLDDMLGRHREPSPDVWRSLDGFEHQMLQGYVAGKEPMSLLRTFPGMSDTKKKRALKEIRESIHAKTGVDIMIPWQKFRLTRSAVLDRHLKYPGDFQPAAGYAATYFCKANWPRLLGYLRQEYREGVPAA